MERRYASFQHLPQEIQDMIFLHLSAHEAAICALVCQGWFNIFARLVLASFTPSSHPNLFFTPAIDEYIDNEAHKQQQEEWRRQQQAQFRMVLDSYQKMAGFLLAHKERKYKDTTKETNKKESYLPVQTRIFKGLGGHEPRIPCISESAVEQILRNNDNSDELKEVRISGWWKPLDDLQSGSLVASTTRNLFPTLKNNSKGPQLPRAICGLRKLQLVDADSPAYNQEIKLMSLLQQSSSQLSFASASSSSSTSYKVAIGDSGIQLSRSAILPVLSHSARIIGALPGGLLRLTMESVEKSGSTIGMVAASGRTLEDHFGKQHTLSNNAASMSKPRQRHGCVQETTRFSNFRRLHHAGLTIDKEVFIPFLRRFQNLNEIHLSLPESLFRYSKDISEALSTSCPSLNVAVFGGHGSDIQDTDLAYLIESSSCGWKTLATDTHCVFGFLSAAAVVRNKRHLATLENFRVTTGDLDFPSSMIHELLCSAKRLKRFEGRSFYRDWAPMMRISAQDMIQGEWACTDLETFHCAISNIPRPDLKQMKNGKPLRGPLHAGESMDESFKLQKLVYQQLGRLTKLRELVLGYRSCEGKESTGGFITDEDRWWDQGVPEADYYYSSDDNYDSTGESSSSEDDDDGVLPTGLLYDCLSMSLESGLEELKNLTELTWLSLEGISHCVKNKDRQWIKQQWPKMFVDDDDGSEQNGSLKRDGFWTKYMICGYHVSEPWYNNWSDIEATMRIE
ncbi:hypothetical protein FBU30_010683 [Linnemannia zychae]|nr:hypothetical protein FBU30_010683 [Linnemannia zychae]